MGAPVAAALAVVLHEDSLLLVQRRNPPDQWLWGFPGGKIEPGETMSEAALRELHEETGIVAEAIGLLEPFDFFHRDASGALIHHFILIPTRCRWLAGLPSAASDASAVGWFEIEQLERRPEQLSARVLPLARAARHHGAGTRRDEAPALRGETS